MATLAELKRVRRADLSRLLGLFKTARQGQQRVEREVQRLVSRTNVVPQPTDLATLARLAADADNAWDKATSSIASAANAWRT
jgi:hypothetical protein